jgi:5-methylcytosine-specific restriction endonuclease McrA
MNRYGKDWFLIRKRVLKRDGYKCRKCGKITDNVHHIIPFAVSSNNGMCNLISLCDKHHKNADHQYSRVGVTKFLKKMMLENVGLMKNG